MFEIEKNVPAPAAKSRAGYPFDDMDVGDSFLAPADSAVRSSLQWYRRGTDKRFKTRRQIDGIRVWRIA